MKNLECKVIIKGLKINLPLFELELSKKYLKQANDVLICERLYNDTEMDFGKLIYRR